MTDSLTDDIIFHPLISHINFSVCEWNCYSYCFVIVTVLILNLIKFRINTITNKNYNNDSVSFNLLLLLLLCYFSLQDGKGGAGVGEGNDTTQETTPVSQVVLPCDYREVNTTKGDICWSGSSSLSHSLIQLILYK